MEQIAFFLDERLLSVTLKRIKKKNTEDSAESYAQAWKVYDNSFKIILKNGSQVSFNDVTLEYVLYYSQEKHIKRNTAKEENHGTLYEKETISLPKKTTREIDTKVLHLKSYRESGYDDVWPDLDGEMHGIMLTLSIQTESGETISRTVKYPEDLKHVWAPKTKDVQID